MLYITQTGESTFITHLKRNNIYFTASTCYYGMRLKGVDSSVQHTFLLQDVSPKSATFQQFNVTGSTTTDLNNGVIWISPKGKWQYTIFSSTGSTVADIDTSCTLERGYLIVE